MAYSRRTVLLATGAGFTAALAGCSSNGNGDDDDDEFGDGPERAVEDWVEALDDNDFETVNDFIADDGDMDPVNPTVWADTDAELLDIEVHERDEDTATIVAEMWLDEDSPYMEGEHTWTMELREIDGEWLFWDGHLGDPD